ncbi:hypothetical protein F3Y22_tig00110812pilonHSYRG00078 [Hibiscus syriacus]|uniref:Uncharacterized protein n=1 Tax=Hibiscus syriacus TaxID=106335 RepID=A0A6A2ZNS6_HIBSY|nr:hypothetical protein F3Y22_tig00110812pilonHSYRG00078 [Hibiscus syriacus]
MYTKCSAIDAWIHWCIWFWQGQNRGHCDSVSFSLGLATTLAVLGVAASFAGKVYGQIGQGLPLPASGLAVIMGLNLLEIRWLQILCRMANQISNVIVNHISEFPALDVYNLIILTMLQTNITGRRVTTSLFFNNFDPRAAAANFPSDVQAYLAELTFALALTLQHTSAGHFAGIRSHIQGGSLLLTYTPATLLLSFLLLLLPKHCRKFSAWINPVRYSLSHPVK